MEFREKDLENLIWNAYSRGKIHDLIERGFPHCTILRRQVELGQYGKIDLLGLSMDYGPRVLYYKIFELKKLVINRESVAQVIRYWAGLNSILTNFCDRNQQFSYKIDICLIGETIDSTDSFCLLSSLTDNFYFYTYNFDFLNGLNFEYHEFSKYDYEGNLNLRKLTFSERRKLING